MFTIIVPYIFPTAGVPYLLQLSKPLIMTCSLISAEPRVDNRYGESVT